MDRFMDISLLDRLIDRDQAADDLYDHLTKNNYQPQDVEWVKGAKVHKANVPLARIKLHKPSDPDKVDRMTRELKSGGKLPRIFLADTGKGPLHIADGGHRALASKKAGLQTVRSYVVTHVTDDPKEPWRVLHDQELSNIQNEQKGREKAQEDNRPLSPRSASTPVGEPPYTQQDPHKPAERYPTGYINVKPSNRQIRVQIRSTPAARATGMQNAPDLGNDYDALLFKYPGDAQAQLHNAGVDMPVSATWYDSSGMYVDHAHLLPGDATPKSPKGPHRYVVEAHSRDFDSLGLGPGSSIEEADTKNGKMDPIQFGDTEPPGVVQ